MPPVVTITPGTKTVVANTPITITVALCSPYMIISGSQQVTEDGIDLTSYFTFTGGSQSGCAFYQSATASIGIAKGTHTFSAQAQDEFSGNIWTGIGGAAYTGATYGFSLIAAAGAVTHVPAPPGGGHLAGAVNFTVTNIGTQTDTAVFNVACAGTAATCFPPPGNVTLAPGASQNVTEQYAVGNQTSGAQSTITLTADRFSSPLVGDTAWTRVTLRSMSAPGVLVWSVTPFSVRTPDDCYAFSLRPHVAYECGNLRVSHALPAVMTYNKNRQPNLVYSSALANPLPLIAAWVTIDSTKGTPDSVVASVIQGGVSIGSTHYNTTASAAFLHQTTQRVVVPINATAFGLATNEYTWSFLVQTYHGGAAVEQDSARFYYAFVTQAASHLGAGWALAGLEALHIYSAHTSFVWYSGDGEARYYATVSGATPHTFSTSSLTRPDTIKIDSTAGHWSYIRYAANNVKVRFDSIGRHVQTIDRLGHITTFTYRSLPFNIRDLDHITIPTPTGTVTYQFNYSTTPGADSGFVTSITAPAVSGQTRNVTLVRDANHQLTSIQQPDGSTIGFGYSPTIVGLITSQTAPRGTLTTFAYDGAQTISTVVTDPGSLPHLAITYNITSAEGRGIAAPIVPDSFYTLINGPRTGITVSRIWPDAYGAAKRTRSAMGLETLIDRANSTYPELITRVQYPNQQVIGLAYGDGRGNLTAMTDSSNSQVLNGVTTYATTSFVWDPKWDFPIAITRPLGDGMRAGYDQNTGNRMWQQPDVDTTNRAHRLQFGYGSGGNSDGLLTSLTQPAEPTTPYTYAYNHMGNDSINTTPLGYQSKIDRDAIGRIVVDSEPIDNTTWETTTTTYDALDRAYVVSRSGPQMVSNFKTYFSNGYGPLTSVAETQTVTTAYNFPSDGPPDTVTRTESPDQYGIGALREWWLYDADDRMDVHVLPDGHRDAFTYDAAGNVLSHSPRNAGNITAQYDSLNRQTMVIRNARNILPQFTPTSGEKSPLFPNCTISGNGGWCIAADTDAFTYDRADRMVTANNADALVSRHYNRDGTLASDTLRIRTAFGSDFSQHVYGINFTYDLDNRRIGLMHPDALAPRTGDLETWAYNAQNLLQTVTDVTGNIFTYGYDADGRLAQIKSAAGSEDWTYDQDSRVSLRADSTYSVGSPPKWSTAILHSDTMSYDARGKIVMSRGQLYQQYNAYNGLGSLVEALNVPQSVTSTYLGEFEELYVPDAFGNNGWQWVKAIQTDQNFIIAPDSAHTNRQTIFNPSTGRDSIAFNTSGGPGHEAQSVWAQGVFYDSAGNRVASSTGMAEPTLQFNAALYEYSYYDAANRLRVMDAQGCSLAVNQVCDWKSGLPYGQQSTFEEYRYDALGRRIWKRGRPDPRCSTGNSVGGCFGSIERTVYDGDAVLYEVRMAGDDSVTVANLERDTVTVSNAYQQWGRVAYTNAHELDTPLSVIRMGYDSTFAAPVPIFPHSDWSDRYDIGTFAHGDSALCSGNDCVKLSWPSASFARYYQDPYWAQFAWPRWTGNVVAGRRDATGRIYLRNRYYDPVTGRFMQEDPIGLTGGLNSYGFGAGDPVNFSDPFGTKVCFDALNTAEENKALADQIKAATNLTFELTTPVPGEKQCVRKETVKTTAGYWTSLGSMFAMLAGWDDVEVDIWEVSTFVGSVSGRDPKTGIYMSVIDDQQPHDKKKGEYNTDPSDPSSLNVTYTTHKGCANHHAMLDLRSLLVHEVLGHLYSQVLGAEIPNDSVHNEVQATVAENVYHRSAGQPTRCSYVTSK